MGDIQRVQRSAPTAEYLEHVNRDGGVIIEQLFSPDQVDRLNADIDRLLGEVQVGPRYDVDGRGDAIHGSRTKRMTGMTAKSKVFRDEWLQDEKVLELADAMLLPTSDSYWLGEAHVIETYPGQEAQKLHRDLETWSFVTALGPSAPEIQVNFLVALTDFSEEVGATRVIPGSHLWEDYNDRGTPDMTIPAVLKKGDSLMLSGKVSHGGGANLTEDTLRRCILLVFNSGFLMPLEAHPFAVPLEVVRELPPKIQGLLGFRSFPDASHGTGPTWRVEYEDLSLALGLDEKQTV